ncbi:MAG: hypothetical protein WC334_04140 [Kiritimatiellales bacterium]
MIAKSDLPSLMINIIVLGDILPSIWIIQTTCKKFRYFSMFKYKVNDAGTVAVVLMRENGSILLCCDGENPGTRHGIPSERTTAKSLVKKVLFDIKMYVDDDAAFLSRPGFC